MRPIPDGFDLSWLIGQELAQLRIGAWQLQLLFNTKGQIDCEGVVVIEGESSSQIVITKDGWGDLSALRGLVGQKVENWKIEGSHEFSISLSGGIKIRFQSQTSPYEDFVIHPQLVVV